MTALHGWVHALGWVRRCTEGRYAGSALNSCAAAAPSRRPPRSPRACCGATGSGSSPPPRCATRGCASPGAPRPTSWPRVTPWPATPPSCRRRRRRLRPARRAPWRSPAPRWRPSSACRRLPPWTRQRAAPPWPLAARTRGMGCPRWTAWRPVWRQRRQRPARLHRRRRRACTRRRCHMQVGPAGFCLQCRLTGRAAAVGACALAGR